ncbi:MAG TPA: hypothetical protein VK018_01505 [Porticoccaceae bacterium]|nr:hypothetical protein [Porticoccaceae bacterium]
MRPHNPLSLDFLASKPEAAARVLQSLEAEQAARYLEAVPVRLLAPVLERAEVWPAARILDQLPLEQNGAVFPRLPYPTAAALLRLQQPARREALLGVLPGPLARALARALAYPDTTVGAWMDMSTPCFHPDLPARECLALLRKAPAPFGGDLVVVDQGHRVLGILPLDRLVREANGARVGDLMDSAAAPLPAEMSLDMAARRADWHRHGALPVRHGNGTYLGTLSRATLHGALARRRPGATEPLGDSLPAHLARAMASTLRGLLMFTASGRRLPPAGELDRGR